jgi:hypothetical protein
MSALQQLAAEVLQRFALQGYGQCFFGSMADVARISSSQRLPDGSCDILPCPTSAALGCPSNTNKVYIMYAADTPLGICS